MSRTYNSRGKVKHLVDEHVEYDEHYAKPQKPTPDYPNDKWEEGLHRHDWSHTSDSDKENIYVKYRRHPNKKSHKGGSKEWRMIPSGGMGNCRQRFAGAYDRSDRMKGARNSTKGSRRQTMKRIARNLVEEDK